MSQKLKTSFPCPLSHHLVSEAQVYELLNWWVIYPFKLSTSASEESCHLLFMSVSRMAGLPHSASAMEPRPFRAIKSIITGAAVLHRHPEMDNKTCLLSARIWQQQPTLPARTGVCHEAIAILPRRTVLGSLTPAGLTLFSKLKCIY